MTPSYRRGPVLAASLLGAFGITCGSIAPNAHDAPSDTDADIPRDRADADAEVQPFTHSTQFFAGVRDFDFDAGSRSVLVPLDRGRISVATMRPFPCTLSANRRWCVDALTGTEATVRSTIGLPDRIVPVVPGSELFEVSDDGHVYTTRASSEPEECPNAESFLDGTSFGCGSWFRLQPNDPVVLRRENGVSLIAADHSEVFFPAATAPQHISIRADGQCALFLEGTGDPNVSRRVHVCADGTRTEIPSYEFVSFHPSAPWMLAANTGQPYRVLAVNDGALQVLGETALVRAKPTEAAAFTRDGSRFYRASDRVQSIPIGLEPPLSAAVESYASEAPNGDFSWLRITASNRVLVDHFTPGPDGGVRPGPGKHSLWLVHEDRVIFVSESNGLLLSPNGERGLYWTDEENGPPRSTLVAFDLANGVEHSRWPGGRYKPNLLWLDDDHYLLAQDQSNRMQILGASWESGLAPVANDLWPPYWEFTLLAAGPESLTE